MSERADDVHDADADVVLPSSFGPSIERHAGNFGALGGLNALIEAANPILATVPQIRHALRHPDPAGLRARMRAQVDAFERSALAVGIAQHHTHTARFALCALLDDSAAAAPWGREWSSLLGELHGEEHGGERFFTVLDELLRRPKRHAELLEFFYVCLALGFEGRYRSGEGGRQALTQTRTRLYEVIERRQRTKPGELSARWRGAQIRSQGTPGVLGPWRAARWSLGAAAFVGFSAALWFAGDRLAMLEANSARIALIAVVGLAWLGSGLWRARRASTADERLLAALVGGVPRDQELGLLRKGAELPWYVLIGAPGSGKTTALLNAGLRFPLGDPSAAEQALQGVAVPRHCDCWFTDQAVIVDTVGRYTTDAVAWVGFLDVLKRLRTRRPLNGIVVTLSIGDLVHWNEAERARYADQVRDRVRELYVRLAVRLPVYLMVTKTDLLAGFNEYFSEFDASERAQVWGATFEPTQQARTVAERFKEELARLEGRLYTLLPKRLQATRDLQKRATIYRFPQQLRVTGPLVGSFIEAAFGGEWAGEAPLVRGVYFCSGTQEGSPFDRVLGTLARSFNLERKVQPLAVGAGKSYFLKRLLNEVIFGESGLAGLERSPERGAEAA
jgi:type IV/VI secretion system ImpK/VasF family protein